MTADEFRRLALDLPEVIEAEHMEHPDFRVAGNIFATLAYPDKSYGMVKLTPADQERFVRTESTTFSAVPGYWGRKGATQVHLKAAKKAVVREALLAAWRNTAPKRLAAQLAAG
jgi:hypothetical protein